MGNVFRRSLWVYVGFEWTDGRGKCFSFQQDLRHSLDPPYCILVVRKHTGRGVYGVTRSILGCINMTDGLLRLLPPTDTEVLASVCFLCFLYKCCQSDSQGQGHSSQ